MTWSWCDGSTSSGDGYVGDLDRYTATGSFTLDPPDSTGMVTPGSGDEQKYWSVRTTMPTGGPCSWYSGASPTDLNASWSGSTVIYSSPVTFPAGTYYIVSLQYTDGYAESGPLDPDAVPPFGELISWTPPPTPPYEITVVAQDGTPFGTVANGKLTRVSWELNGVGAAEISLATTDPDASLLQVGREVQVYYHGDLIWWGPIIRPQAGLRESTWQCAGLLWYFQHRFMGRADRVNQLTNGDFESGETAWAFSGVTHAVNTDMTYVLEGTKSERLEGTTADHDTFAYAGWTHPSGGYPGGDAITGSVWVYVPSASYVGGAANDYGLVLIHRDSGGTVLGTDADTIGDDFTFNKWVELQAVVTNVQAGDTVEIRLFPPHGVAYFDLASLTFMESLSFGYPGPAVDVTDIITGIVDYAQNRVFDQGKSDLNIGTAGSATGVVRQVAYQFAEHRNILDAIMEDVRAGNCDIDIAITPTTRTFTVYPGEKGSLYGTTLELDVNVADFTLSQDLENAASSVIILGPGDGPDRPEGGAIDTSFAGGAFTSEIVEQAPDNTTIGQLDARAAERLAVVAHPEILEVTTLPGAGVIGNLVVGDTVPIVISLGWVAISATYRVVRIDADLIKDQATLTLNVVPT